MKILHTGHMAFQCVDAKKSISFYCDVFGCKPKFSLTYGELLENIQKNASLTEDIIEKSPDLLFYRAHKEEAWLTYLEFEDGFFFEIFQSPVKEPAMDMRRLTGYTHTAFVVEDIHKAYAEMVEKGVKTDGEPQLCDLDHTWQFWFEDPDGNRFEMMEYTKDSLQVTG